MPVWNDAQPIFLQIRQKLIAMILNDQTREGEALPSIRQIATDLAVNPLTVTRAFQSLVDQEIVESRRGLGMYVVQGARERLLVHERKAFLEEEWPSVKARIETLGLSSEDLFDKE